MMCIYIFFYVIFKILYFKIFIYSYRIYIIFLILCSFHIIMSDCIMRSIKRKIKKQSNKTSRLKSTRKKSERKREGERAESWRQWVVGYIKNSIHVKMSKSNSNIYSTYTGHNMSTWTTLPCKKRRKTMITPTPTGHIFLPHFSPFPLNFTCYFIHSPLSLPLFFFYLFPWKDPPNSLHNTNNNYTSLNFLSDLFLSTTSNLPYITQLL